jgi:hypothetical protein
MYGGSYLTTTPLSSAAFKANWQTSQVFGMLAVALQPATIAAKAAQTTNVTASAVGTVTIAATASQTVTNFNDAGIPFDATCIIPGYQYPTVGLWGASMGSPVGGRGYIIANVNSGPGTTVNSDYTTAIAAAIAAGWTVLGYVDTNSGATSSTTVETNITKWSTLYGVTSIFFDRASTLSTKVGYYTTLTTFVHTASAGALSVLNPGSPPYSGYMSLTVCDGICVFDNTYAVFQSTPPPNYANTGLLILHIVTATPLANATTQMAASVALGANVLYVTDETDGNFDVLPSYFAGENVLLANLATATAGESVVVTATAVGVAVTTVAATGSFTASVTGSAVGFAAAAASTTNVIASAAGIVSGAATAVQTTAFTATAVGTVTLAGTAASTTTVSANAAVTIQATAAESVEVTGYAFSGTPVDACYIIPAYQYPTLGLWPDLASFAPNGSPGYVIANPSSGPGTVVDPNYTAAIAAAQSAGWRVLGYVDTNSGATTTGAVETNITHWSTLYGIHDIFFDRVSTLSTKVSYHTTLTAYVRAALATGLSILNPGTVPYSGYFATAVCDGIILFEDTYATFQSTPPPNYSGSPVMIGHIVQDVPVGNVVSQIAASATLGATLQYVTDESDGNYDVLPSYFTNENILLAAPNPDLATAVATASVTAIAVGTMATSSGAQTTAFTATAVGTASVSGSAGLHAAVTALAVGVVNVPATASLTVTTFNDAGIPFDATYIIPAYQYPTVGMWGTSFGSPSGGRGYIIANVNSGPGTVVDSDYTTAIAAAVAAGWTVLGYVPTNYGATATGTVEAMVTKWSTLYGIHSIFFDEGSTLSTKVSYYTTLTAFVHAAHAGSKTILNPGTTPDPGYMSLSVCDGICVFEDTYAAFLLSPPPNYSGSSLLICHIVQATPLANATSQIIASVALGANLLHWREYPSGQPCHGCRFVLGIGCLRCCRDCPGRGCRCSDNSLHCYSGRNDQGSGDGRLHGILRRVGYCQ